MARAGWGLAGALLAVWGAWASLFVVERARAGRAVWDEGRCRACGESLGPWRQLPLLGGRAGCAGCGTGGTGRDAVLEWSCAVAGAAAGAAAGPVGALCAGLAGWLVGAGLGWRSVSRRARPR